MNITSCEAIVSDETWNQLEDLDWLRQKRYSSIMETRGNEGIFSFESIIAKKIWRQVENFSIVKRNRNLIKNGVECDKISCEGAGYWTHHCYLPSYRECKYYPKNISV